ncbi:unnamed protein product [Brassica rapa]|uniref:Uncharacterized protein n=2 Tax=Brassica TaxID=3705 RepID=A0A8D9HGS8_BRACM|nr:unnamed protein product [Brassica napus]CAG7897531.1 unnamed protein product [Brassica rapa]
MTLRFVKGFDHVLTPSSINLNKFFQIHRIKKTVADRISGCVRMRIVALIVSAFKLSSLKCRYCASVSTYILCGHSDLFISIHVLISIRSFIAGIQSSYQDLSFYQAYMFKAPMVTVKNGSSSRYGLMLN